MQTIAAPVEKQPLEVRMSCRPYALRKGNPLPSTLSLWTAEQTCETRWLFVVCRTPHWGTSSSNTLSLHCPQSLVNKEFLTVCDAVNKGSYCGKQGCFQCMQPPLTITYYKNRCENLHQISRYYLISAKWDERWALLLNKCFIHCTVHLQFLSSSRHFTEIFGLYKFVRTHIHTCLS